MFEGFLFPLDKSLRGRQNGKKITRKNSENIFSFYCYSISRYFLLSNLISSSIIIIYHPFHSCIIGLKIEDEKCQGDEMGKEETAEDDRVSGKLS